VTLKFPKEQRINGDGEKVKKWPPYQFEWSEKWMVSKLVQEYLEDGLVVKCAYYWQSHQLVPEIIKNLQ